MMYGKSRFCAGPVFEREYPAPHRRLEFLRMHVVRVFGSHPFLRFEIGNESSGDRRFNLYFRDVSAHAPYFVKLKRRPFFIDELGRAALLGDRHPAESAHVFGIQLNGVEPRLLARGQREQDRNEDLSH